MFLNGSYDDPAWERRLAASADLLLAADGGAGRLAALGLRPDVVVGDLDSLDPREAAALAATGVPLVRHPVRKDFTDGELAAAEALARGAGEVLFAGALGDLDHELGHLALLRRLAGRGARARLVAPGLLATVVIGPAVVRLTGVPGARLSLAALADPTLLSLDGLSYPLDHDLLRTDECRGLGNEVTGDEATVTVHEGAAALLLAADPLAAGVLEERPDDARR